MWKLLINSMLVIAVLIVSLIPVGAVDYTTAPTEVITETVTEVVTEQPTEHTTEVVTEHQQVCFLVFTISCVFGLGLAKAFSFWKW